MAGEIVEHSELTRIAFWNDFGVKMRWIAIPEPWLANPSFCAMSLGSVAVRPILLIRRLTIPTHVLHWQKISYNPQKFLEKSLGWKVHPCLCENLTHLFTFGVGEGPDRKNKLPKKFFANLRVYPKQSVVRDHRFWAPSSSQVTWRTCAIFGFKKTLTESTY